MISHYIIIPINKGLNKLFNKVGKNRFAGVGIGAVATALVQSSAATTVLVVGLVNSG
ncbi:MAG: Na/Pi cotransporter family protein, partial [Bacilli bacterium]|nr:Na/Pi cotransporter family protein [Bacilli bacterium]